MLLIKFIAIFIVFIGYLWIQIEHEEINWNVELKNHKAEGRRQKEKQTKKNEANPFQFRNFAISQFRNCCEISQLADFLSILFYFCCPF